MRLVMIASDNPVSTYLAQEVSRQRIVNGIIRPVKSNGKSKAKAWPKLGFQTAVRFGQVLRGRYFSRQNRRLQEAISQHLFGHGTWPALNATHEIPSQSINSRESAQLFKSLEPDFVLVCGAPILSESILSIPRVSTINVHFGIAPEYRGQDSLFWTLYRRDYDKIGFTLHVIDKGIDSGPILARGYPSLVLRESEATLWAKCARLAAGISVELLQQADERPLHSLAQSSRYPLFREQDRTILKDVKLLWRRWALAQCMPVRPERVERIFAGIP